MTELKNYEAVKALIFYKDKALIVTQEDFSDLPGGRKNFGEKDSEALKREVMEEVGLRIKIKRLLNKWSVDSPERNIHLDGKTYLCETNSNQVKLGKELVNFEWVPKEKLKDLNVPNWLEEAIEKK